ncbi:MAG: 23S rRNA (pseudouridine(1915)-N(3))-methyltransferase RlmH [Bacteroidales bacterium]
MKITVVAIGKTVKGFVYQGVEEYLKRLKRYIKVDFIVIPDVKSSKNLTQEQLLRKEELLLLPFIDGCPMVYLLDENGKQFTSVQLAQFLESKMLTGSKELLLIIGGAYGVSNNIKKSVQGKIALSSLTFSHQMVRVILFEQLYRAMTILKGEPYHHN